MRSWILVPADKDKALAAVGTAGADAVVVDLSKAVGGDAMMRTRIQARDWMINHRHQVLAARHYSRWARIAGLDTPYWREDLEAVMEGEPNGIVLTDCRGSNDIQQLAAVLYEIENRRQLHQGQTEIVVQLGATPASVLTMGALAQEMHPRVSGVTWDAAALARAIGARRTRGPGGAWSDPLAFLRAQALLLAHSLGIEAIEPPYRDARDATGLRLAADAARADGFSGMFAIHPAQIAGINAAFDATPEEYAEARELLGAFSLNPSAESLPFRGRRVGQSQLRRAKALIEQA